MGQNPISEKDAWGDSSVVDDETFALKGVAVVDLNSILEEENLEGNSGPPIVCFIGAADTLDDLPVNGLLFADV